MMGCQKHSVTVHNVPGVTTDAVADYGIALLLLGTRRLDQNLKRKQSFLFHEKSGSNPIKSFSIIDNIAEKISNSAMFVLF